jgi:hypothetical protein
MYKFRSMALKVEDEYPSPLASTSSITLEDPLSRSPSTKLKAEVVSDHVNIEGHPVKPRAVRPSPDSPDDVKMDDDDQPPRKTDRSPKPEYPLITKSETRTSTSASASPRTGSSTPSLSTKPLKKGPQLISDLPITTDDAMKTFVQIQENHYQYSTLGRSREALESMTCECPPNSFRACSTFFSPYSLDVVRVEQSVLRSHSP